MLLFVSILRALCELAGLALVGQGVLYVLAGARREQNPFYRLLKLLTSPVVRLARLITPRLVLDQHVGWVALLIVALVWLFAGQQKLAMCLGEYRDQPACAEMVQKYEAQRAESRSP